MCRLFVLVNIPLHLHNQVATDVGCDEDPHRHDNIKLSIEALRDATPMVVYSAKTLSLNPDSEVSDYFLNRLLIYRV